MVDFDSLCEKYEIDLGDKKEEFTKELLLNYKTVSELERNKEKLAKAEESLAAYKDDMQKLQSQIETLSGTADEIAMLKSENEAYRAKEAEAAKRAEQEAFEHLLDKQIAEVVGDRKFVNAYVEKAFLSDFKSAIVAEENKDKTVAELFASMTDDQEGLFKVEQSYGSEHPGISEGASSSDNFKRENRDVFADWFEQNFGQF